MRFSNSWMVIKVFEAVDYLRTLSSRWQAMKYAYCQTRWPTSYITTVGQPTYTLNERLLRYMELSNWPPGCFDLGFHRQLRMYFHITLSPSEIQKMDLALLAQNHESYCEPAEQYKRGYGAIALALCGGQLNLTTTACRASSGCSIRWRSCRKSTNTFPGIRRARCNRGSLATFTRGCSATMPSLEPSNSFAEANSLTAKAFCLRPRIRIPSSTFATWDRALIAMRCSTTFEQWINSRATNSCLRWSTRAFCTSAYVAMLILSHVESQNNALGITAPDVFPHGRPLLPWLCFPPMQSKMKSFDSREDSTIFITPVGAGDPKWSPSPST